MAARYDFAIFGTRPLAALLCGLLAHRHDKLVLTTAAVEALEARFK